MSEPDWLGWAREMQALAQSGLTFTRDPFDRERYQSLRALAARVVAAESGAGTARVEALFTAQEGYATPKIDVRAAVFDAAGRILMVREVLDQHRWTLPGGWADVNLTPGENVVKEVLEESGFEVHVRKLAAVWDRTRQGHGAFPFSTYKLFFVCEITGGAALTSIETSDVAFFAEDALPEELSTGRVLPSQLRKMFEHWRWPELATEFD
jgi:ADP-ribose pyrophosphatase YjhB (NUDIX family)